jgi:hypothetical protein
MTRSPVSSMAARQTILAGAIALLDLSVA